MDKTTREKIDDLYNALQGVIGTHDFSTNTKQILDIPTDMCPQWVSGLVIPAKAVVQYKGVKYYCATGATAQAHFPPDGQGLEAVYKPYTDSECKEWIYNEYVESGWKRTYSGKTYEVYNTGGGALLNNLYTPNLNPANWKIV